MPRIESLRRASSGATPRKLSQIVGDWNGLPVERAGNAVTTQCIYIAKLDSSRPITRSCAAVAHIIAISCAFSRAIWHI